jgi:hypothetical protein
MQSQTDKSAADKIRSYLGAYAASMPPNNIDGSFIRQAVLTSVTTESETSNAKAIWSLVIPPLCSICLQECMGRFRRDEEFERHVLSAAG